MLIVKDERGKEIYLVRINFNSGERNIKSYEIERLS